jgi:hypothetical protein
MYICKPITRKKEKEIEVEYREEVRNIFYQTSRNRHSLLLSPAEFQTPLPDHGLPLLRKTLYEVFYLSTFRSLLDLLHRGVHASILDVVQERVIEQHRVLRNNANSISDTLLRV